MKRSVTNRLVTISTLAIFAYLLLYFVARPALPERLPRHAGADGIGYSASWIMVLVVSGIAVVALGIGIHLYRDFISLGHWYPGPKATVVCFLSAGLGVLGLGMATIITVWGAESEELGSLPIAVGLLALLLVFAVSAGLLARSLPRAQHEVLGR